MTNSYDQKRIDHERGIVQFHVAHRSEAITKLHAIRARLRAELRPWTIRQRLTYEMATEHLSAIEELQRKDKALMRSPRSLRVRADLRQQHREWEQRIHDERAALEARKKELTSQLDACRKAQHKLAPTMTGHYGLEQNMQAAVSHALNRLGLEG